MNGKEQEMDGGEKERDRQNNMQQKAKLKEQTLTHTQRRRNV